MQGGGEVEGHFGVGVVVFMNYEGIWDDFSHPLCEILVRKLEILLESEDKISFPVSKENSQKLPP